MKTRRWLSVALTYKTVCCHNMKDHSVGTENMFQAIYLRLSLSCLMTIADRDNTALAHTFKVTIYNESVWVDPLSVGFLLHLRWMPFEIWHYDPHAFLSPVRQVFRVCLCLTHARSSTMKLRSCDHLLHVLIGIYIITAGFPLLLCHLSTQKTKHY
jgi:hypothetical protein